MAKLNLTDEQKSKLRAGYKRAQEFPRGFDMELWATRDDSAPCGTVCCYAGELVLANSHYTPAELLRLDVPYAAGQAVGLTQGQLFTLFRVIFWPTDLQERYRRTRRSKTRANLLAEVVERFIEADGDTSDW